MPAWIIIAFSGTVFALFLIFLSRAIQNRAHRIISMFVFTLLISSFMGYGLYSAHLDAQRNLGKPISQIEGGEYEIFWIARNVRDNKVYLVADKMGDQEKIARYYAIDPSDPFLKKLDDLLKRNGNMKLRVGEGDGGEITFELHPNPPEPLPPKVEP
jgi:hypothetical protein